MRASTCHLQGILLIEPDVHSDRRGFFTESFEQERYREIGILEEFVQDMRRHPALRMTHVGGAFGAGTPIAATTRSRS